MYTLTQERGEHASAIEQLLDQAFGAARWEKTCERLREGQKPLPGMSLVALGDGAAKGEVVGTVRLWRVDAAGRPAVMLGPLAVDQAWRNQGIGAALVNEALKRATEAGEESVLLVGDAPYYRRFGFKPGLTRSLKLPGPVERNRFLARELVPHSLKGLRGLVLKAA